MIRKRYSLVGVDGNAYCVMGYVENAMRQSGFTKEEIQDYGNDATSGNYDHLIYVSVNMIDKVNERLEKEGK